MVGESIYLKSPNLLTNVGKRINHLQKNYSFKLSNLATLLTSGCSFSLWGQFFFFSSFGNTQLAWVWSLAQLGKFCSSFLSHFQISYHYSKACKVILILQCGHSNHERCGFIFSLFLLYLSLTLYFFFQN